MKKYGNALLCMQHIIDILATLFANIIAVSSAKIAVIAKQPSSVVWIALCFYYWHMHSSGSEVRIQEPKSHQSKMLSCLSRWLIGEFIVTEVTPQV